MEMTETRSPSGRLLKLCAPCRQRGATQGQRHRDDGRAKLRASEPGTVCSRCYSDMPPAITRGGRPLKQCEKCRARTAKAMVALRTSQPESYAAYQKAFKQQQRKDALAAYGGRCVCCGEDRFEFLTFDHINGGGNEHRETAGSGTQFVSWLRRHGYPDLVQLLCYNCNGALGHQGYCPHNPERRRPILYRKRERRGVAT